MFPTLAPSLSTLLACLLLPTLVVSQSLWDRPVDFSGSAFWPSEPCVRSCLSGNQCMPCGGYSLSTWMGCSNNWCFCDNMVAASNLLFNCISVNCCIGCVTTDPRSLIEGYCVATRDQVAAGAGGSSGARVATSVTPLSNPYATDASGEPPTPTTTATTAQATDTGLSRSDKIALGVGLGVGIPTVISSVIVMIQYCRGG